MNNHGFITGKDLPALELYCRLNPVPEWFNPEDESSTIAATIYGINQAIKELTQDE